MVKSLNEEQIDELKEAFNSYDHDRDGFISMRELARLFRQLGQNPTEAEILTMIKELDSDHDWMISFDEFVTLMATKMKNEDTEQEVRDAFRVFDVNGNGVIAAEELCNVAKNLGEKLSEEDAIEMIKSAKGGEGEVTMTVNDFISLMDAKN